MSCPHSLVADGPLEADALLALEEALRVDLGLDRLELRESVRAPHVLLQRDALLFLLGVREVAGAVGGRAPRLRVSIQWPWTINGLGLGSLPATH